MNLYDIVIIKNPTKVEAESGVEPQIVARLEIHAPDERTALLSAGAAAHATLSEVPVSRLEVRLRPFVK